jgi:intracellular septation protein
MSESTRQKPAELGPLMRLALDLGPLLLFFFSNSRWGIFAATGIFMAATVLSILITYLVARRIAVMPLVSAVVVMIFGGLTLYLQDELFIKLKPTIIYSIFAAILFAGLWMGRSLLALVFDSLFRLDPEGWRKLTWRWAIFFVLMAIANEIVWRSFSTDAWVAIKTFGFVPVTVLFAVAQAPLIAKHAIADKQA